HERGGHRGSTVFSSRARRGEHIAASDAFPMNPLDTHAQNLTRRAFLGASAAGLGSLALGSLLNPELFGAPGAGPDAWRGVINPLHHPAKIKRVIYLYQAGGPSHLETFDYKQKLRAMDGMPMPESFTQG